MGCRGCGGVFVGGVEGVVGCRGWGVGCRGCGGVFVGGVECVVGCRGCVEGVVCIPGVVNTTIPPGMSA